MKYYAIKWVKNGTKIKLGIDLPNASLLYFIYLFISPIFPSTNIYVHVFSSVIQSQYLI